jgi:serine/threonine protein kinase
MASEGQKKDSRSFASGTITACSALEESLKNLAGRINWSHKQARYFRNKLKRIIEGEGPGKQDPERLINSLNHVRSSNLILWSKEDFSAFDQLEEAFTDMHIRSRRTLLDHSSDGLSPASFGGQADDREEVVDKFIDKYSIDKKLGEGNMGLVYLGFNPDTDRHVALKKMRLGLRTKYKEAFLKEAKAAGKIHSPHCVQIYDVIQHRVENVPVIVCEYVDGMNAEAFLSIEAFESLSPARAFSVPAALLILEQMLKGLRAVHAAHIIHQDLKPENYMVARHITEQINALYLKHGQISHNQLEAIFFNHRYEPWLKLHDWGLAIEKASNPIDAHFQDLNDTADNSIRQLRWLRSAHFGSPNKASPKVINESDEYEGLRNLLNDGLPRPDSGGHSIPPPPPSVVFKRDEGVDPNRDIDEEVLTSANIRYDQIPCDKRGGTPIYMAPEQLCGQGISRTTDVFALGLIFYSLLTGQSAKQARRHSIGLTEPMLNDFGTFLTTVRDSAARYAVDVKEDPAISRLAMHTEVLEILQLMCARRRTERISSLCLLQEVSYLLETHYRPLSDSTPVDNGVIGPRAAEQTKAPAHEQCNARILTLENELYQLRTKMRRVAEDILRSAAAEPVEPDGGLIATGSPNAFFNPRSSRHEERSPTTLGARRQPQQAAQEHRSSLSDTMETQQLAALKRDDPQASSDKAARAVSAAAAPEMDAVQPEICKEILTGKTDRARQLTMLNPTIASRLVDERLKKLELNKIEEISVETARVLADQKGSLSLNGLTSFSDNVASALAEHVGRQIYLNGVTDISTQTARRLCRYQQVLRLSGLKKITDALSEVFRDFDGNWLVLNGVELLTPRQAEIISQIKSHLKLNGVTTLTPDVAEKLSGIQHNLSLDALTELSVESARFLARHSFQLSLKGLKDLTPEMAAVLASHQGRWLILDALTELDKKSALELMSYKGGLSLNGLKTLDKSVAETLKAHDGRKLALNGLKSMKGLATVLARYRGYLQLDGVAKLTDKEAKILSKHRGKLSLRGLKELSQEAAKELAGKKGRLAISRRFQKITESNS